MRITKGRQFWLDLKGTTLPLEYPMLYVPTGGSLIVVRTVDPILNHRRRPELTRCVPQRPTLPPASDVALPYRSRTAVRARARSRGYSVSRGAHANDGACERWRHISFLPGRCTGHRTGQRSSRAWHTGKPVSLQLYNTKTLVSQAFVTVSCIFALPRVASPVARDSIAP